MPIVAAVCEMPPALARFWRPTISGVRALIVGPVIASPMASVATNAMIRIGWVAKASATHTPTWTSPTDTIRVRLSTRSASRPAIGPTATSGTAAASRMPATARPLSPRATRIRASAVAASMSPQPETARASAAI